MVKRYALMTVALACVLASAVRAQVTGPLPGPNIPYLSFADSPFKGVGFAWFHLEDFEDHLLNVPSVTTSSGGPTSLAYGPGYHDSVDADDGVIDGSGLRGDDFFSWNSTVTITFDQGILGHLPTHAGLVWTDGLGPIRFEAFDQNGISLGIVTGHHADNSHDGTTIDDRFYGAVHGGGISAIKISSGPDGAIEFDHLQYGYVAPEGNGIAMFLAGTAPFLAGCWIRRRKKGTVHE